MFMPEKNLGQSTISDLRHFLKEPHFLDTFSNMSLIIEPQILNFSIFPHLKKIEEKNSLNH